MFIALRNTEIIKEIEISQDVPIIFENGKCYFTDGEFEFEVKTEDIQGIYFY